MPNIPPANVDTFCFATDLICYGDPIVDGAHLSYGIDAWAAAAFVQSKVTL